MVVVLLLMMMLTVFGDGMGAQDYCKYVLMAVMAVMPMIFDEGAGALGIMANLSYIGLMQSVDNGISKAFFKTFLAKYAQARHSR